MANVLLADDSITMHKVVELVLPSDGFHLKAVKTGEEALAVLPSFKPDIVLADVEMPEMNGYRLCEEIKNNPDTKDIPVVLLAGAFEPMDQELAQKVGADGSLIKPFESGDLLDMISTLTGGSPEEFAAEEVMAEEVEEAPGLEDELWEIEALEEPTEVLEEISNEAVEEALPAEAALAEVVEEAVLEAEALPEEAAIEEKPPQEVLAPAMPDVEMLSDMFKEAANEKLSELLRGLDIRALLLEALMPTIKDSVESVLWEVAPELTEKLIKEALKDTMASLTKEMENVIWETVPELAESIIRKEIENIRAGGA